MHSSLLTTALLAVSVAALPNPNLKADHQLQQRQAAAAAAAPAAAVATPAVAAAAAVAVIPAVGAAATPAATAAAAAAAPAGGAAAVPANPDPAVPFVTVYYLATQIAPGNVVQVPHTFTQTFAAGSAVGEEQWASATAGSVGLGTITGEVGVVRTGVGRAVNGSADSAAGLRAEIGGSWQVGGVVVAMMAVGGMLVL